MTKSKINLKETKPYQITNRKNIFLFLFIGLLLFGQCGAILKVPPGTKKISKTAYFDKAEVTNIAWLEYLYWLKNNYGNESIQYVNALPDLSLWNEAYGNDDFFKTNYKYYPIVGITYEQALEFCKWRSKIVSEKLKANVIYGLPSAEDYIKNLAKSSKNQRPGLYATKRAKKIVGICDNAYEMLDKKGNAISGFNELECMTIIEYKQPQSNLSFRCKAIVVK